MSAASIIQLIAGLCFAALTLGRPFMRSDSGAHRSWHTVIGVVGMIALGVSAVLNSESQKAYATAFQSLSNNVQKLAGPANAKGGDSVDQILAAAAAKLIQQDNKIQQLNRQMKDITHPSNGLYFGDNMVGQSQGDVLSDGRDLSFQLIIAGTHGLDFSQEYDFQNHKIRCTQPAMVGQSGTFGVMRTHYPNMKCTMISKD